MEDSWNDFLRSLPSSDETFSILLSHLNARNPGTCVRLFTTEEYYAWQGGQYRTLLCVAPPGSGKSVLASVVFDRLERENRQVACIFNTWPQLQTADVLLTILLRQLAQNVSSRALPALLPKLTALEKVGASGRTLAQAFHDLAAVMRHGFPSSTEPFFFILDGLDEYNKKNLRLLLSSVYKLCLSFNIKIFATSRDVLDELDDLKPYITTPLDSPRRDAAYIIESLQSVPSSVIPDKDALSELVIAAAGGIPNITDNIVNSLLATRTEAQYRRFLKSMSLLSGDLVQIFNALTGPVLAQRGSGFAWDVIEWVTFSARPLTMKELQHALAADVLEDLQTLPELQCIIADLGGIVHYDEKTEVVRFFHLSVKEYFLHTQHERFSRAHENLTARCIAQISHTSRASGPCESDREYEDRLRANPFLQYAACYWGYHSQRCSKPSQEVMEFLRDKIMIEISGQAIMMTEKDSTGTAFCRETCPKNITGLHLSAYFGLEQAAARLIQSGSSVYCKDSSGHTPLWWAARFGQKALIRLLGQHDGMTLRLLLQAREAKLMKCLLEAGCNVNTTDIFKKTPLHDVVTLKDIKLANILISAGANMNAQDINGVTPPELALDLHSSEMLMVFLANHADTRMISVDKFRQSLGLTKDTPLQLCQEEERGVFLRGLRGGRRFIEEPGTERSVLQRSFAPPTQQLIMRDLRFRGESPPEHFQLVILQPDPSLDETLQGSWSFVVQITLPPYPSFKDDDAINSCGEKPEGHYLICWNVKLCGNDYDTQFWLTTSHLTTLPHVWLPQNGEEFFQYFLAHIKTEWLSLCDSYLTWLNTKRRSEVLKARGSDPGLLDQLLHDGKQWVDQRMRLQNTTSVARRFAREYSNRYSGSWDLRELMGTVDGLSNEISKKLDQLDKTSQDLLQMVRPDSRRSTSAMVLKDEQEFNRVSIREAQRSVSMSASMKRLSWITFIFLPLTFVATCFGMNIDILQFNPAWWIYIPFATVTILMMSTVWLVFKYTNLERKTEEMARRISPKKWIAAALEKFKRHQVDEDGKSAVNSRARSVFSRRDSGILGV